MKIFSLTAGITVEIDEQKYDLLWRTADQNWQLEHRDLRSIRTESESTLLLFYEQQRLKIVGRKGAVGDAAKPEYVSQPIEQMPKNDQIRVRAQLAFLDGMAEREYPGWHVRVGPEGRSGFSEALKEVSTKVGFKRTISKSAYYEWRDTLERGENDPAALRSKYRGRAQIAAEVRQIIMDEIRTIINEAQTASPRNPFKPMKMLEIRTRIKSAIAKANTDIAERNRLSPSQPPLSDFKAPSSKSTYWHYWELFPAEERSLVLQGRRATREAFRGGRGAPRPKEVLDRVEYDECHLPFMVYDEGLAIALGRPWLSWFVDVVSELPIGLYLGFEQSSDLAICSALRSACTPKAFLATEYRISQIYPVFGIPRTFVLDNALSQHGATVAAMTYDLRNSHRFAPIETGWFKGAVENSFNVIANSFLSLLPGFVLPGVKDRNYDPQKHGCIGFRALLELIWKWVVDLYAIDKRGSTGSRRIDIWQESTNRIAPDWFGDLGDADVIFNVVRPGKVFNTLDHRGVVFESLRYHSEELQCLRSHFGANIKVRIRINPADLEYVLVQFRSNTPWVRARALDWRYARGRSLRQHLLCKKEAKARFNEDSIGALELAQFELAARIQEAILIAQSISFNSFVAKTWGLGSNHITNALDERGSLGIVGGPFAGQPIAPISVSQVLGPPVADPIVPQRSPLIATNSQPVPKFVSDLSLRSKP